MIRCPDCGQRVCDPNTCKGWKVNLEPALSVLKEAKPITCVKPGGLRGMPASVPLLRGRASGIHPIHSKFQKSRQCNREGVK